MQSGRRCPRCGAQVPEPMQFCGMCGASLTIPPPPVYAPPYVPATKPGRSKLQTVLIAAGAVVLLGCICFAAAMIWSQTPAGQAIVATSAATKTIAAIALVTERARPTATATPTPPPTATATPVPDAPTVHELRRQHDKMTDAQWTAYKATVIGLRVRFWTGYVYNVTDDFLGMRLLEIDDDRDGVTDVQFQVSDADALKYSKGDKITYSGRVSRIDELFWVILFLDDVTIEE